MKNLIIVFSILSLISCGIINTVNKAQPTLIVKGSGITVTTDAFTKTLGQSELTFYDIDSFKIKLTIDTKDSTYLLKLHKDSTVVLTGFNKKTFNRY